jgi:hypothetical protein
MQRAKLRVQQAAQHAEVSRAESVLCHATLSVNKAASPHCWLQLLEKENKRDVPSRQNSWSIQAGTWLGFLSGCWI